MSFPLKFLPIVLLFASISRSLAQEIRFLDDSFNANQRVTQREILDGWFLTYALNPMNSVTIQPDGKIIAGGIIPSTTGEYRSLVRFHLDGTRDTSFGTGPLLARVSSQVLTPTGEVFALGMLDDRSDALFKFNSNGQLLWQRKLLGSHDYKLRAPLIAFADSSILVGGYFTNVANAERKHLALLNENGNLQSNFNLNIDGPVTAAAIQQDGKVLIAGNFTSINGSPRLRLARLTATGELDSSFDPGSVFSAEVLALAVQSDRKILASGKFNKSNGSVADRIVRLHEGGAIDNSFVAGLDETARRIVIDREGRLVLGGDFQSVNGVTRRRMARLVENGALDTAFDPAEGSNDKVTDIAIDQNGAYVITGYFTKVAHRTRHGIARVFPTSTGATVDFAEELFPAAEQYKEAHVHLKRIGALDRDLIVDVWVEAQTEPHLQEFNAQTFQVRFAPGETAKSVTVTFPDDGLVEPDEVLEVKARVQGESFTKTAGINILDDEVPVIREGTIPGLSAYESFNQLAVRGGQVALAGQIHPSGEWEGSFSGVKVLNLDGSTNGFKTVKFEPEFGVNFRSLDWTPDGKLVVGGSFSMVNGEPIQNLVRLLPNGSVDPSFRVSNAPFRSFVMQPDGKLLVDDGTRTESGHAKIIRINLDGSEDNTFESHVPDAAILKIGVQSDGKILVADSRSGLQRYEANSQIDSTFTAVPEVENFIITPNGKVLIQGSFQNVEGLYRPGLARLESNGKVDRTFVPEPGFEVLRSFPRDDGKIIVQRNYAQQWVLLNEDGSLNRDFKLKPEWGNFADSTEHVETLDGGKILLNTLQVVPAFNSQLSSVIAERNPVIMAEQEGNQSVKLTRIGNVSRREVLNLFLKVIKGEFSGDYVSAMSVTFEEMQRQVETPHFQSRDDLIEEDEIFEEIIGSKDVPNFVPGSYQLIVVDKNGRPGSADFITPLSLRTNSSRIFDGVNGWFVIAGTTDEAITMYHSETGQILNFQLRTEGSRLIQVALGLEDGVLVGGPFFGTPDNPVTGIVRFRMDGTLDPNFESPSLPVFPFNLLQEPGGTFLVGGTTSKDDFTTTIVRLNQNGSIADRFNLPFMARHGPLLAPNKLLYSLDGQLRLLDLSTREDDGQFKRVETFHANGGSGLIEQIVLHGNDIFISGNFNEVNGVPMTGFAKLDKEGNLDSSYNPVLGFGLIYSFEVDNQGRAVIFGNFNSVDGIERNGAVRLNADGTVDLGFDVGYSLQAGSSSPWVDSTTILPNGELFVMTPHPLLSSSYGVARLSGDLPLRAELRPGWTGMVDLRVNTRPQAEYRIESSNDLSTWQNVVTTNAPNFHLVVPLPATGVNQFFRVEQR